MGLWVWGRSCSDEVRAECGICYSYRLGTAGEVARMHASSADADAGMGAGTDEPGGGAGVGGGSGTGASVGAGIGSSTASTGLVPLQELPDRVCDNAKCARPFHRPCLSEWLRSAPNSRQSFNTVFGECPYCSTAISVSITEFS